MCPPTDRNPVRRVLLFLAVCGLGVSAFITQLTLMRELLSVFEGNELVFGVVLGNWLLLTGIGSQLGKTAPRLKDPLCVLILAEMAVALLPIGDVLLVRALRNVVFLRGAAIGVTGTVTSSFVLLAPYCLITGYRLTLASLILARRHGPESIGQVYFLDNVGDVLGGLLFSFVLVWWLDHFQTLYVPAMLNLLLALAVAVVFRRRGLGVLAAGLGAVFVGVVLTTELDRVSAEMQYPGQRVVHRESSPYGNVLVTESAGQLNFIENGVVLFSSDEVQRVEEAVHFAMAQRPDAGRVLLIGGGASGTAREVLKYGPRAVDYVELDPTLIDVAEKYLPESLADERIRVVETDGRLFLKETEERYDVVIVDVPDPSTSQLNRFYTIEFFRDVKARLRKKGTVPFSLRENRDSPPLRENRDSPQAAGVVCISLGHFENYLSDELANLLAAAHRTLREEFDEVLMIPGSRVFFLASDGPLTLDIAERIEEHGIATKRVKRSHLGDVLDPLRLAAVDRAISDDAPVNRDFSPILYYYHLRHWMSRFRFRFGLLEAVLAAVLLVYLVRIRPVPLALFTTGLAASALEVVLLVGVQILYGCLYYQVGVIITMFMLGLGIGSASMNRVLARRKRWELAGLELGIAVFAACLPLVLIGLAHLPAGTVQLVASQAAVPFLALVLAMLVGAEFPLAGKVDFSTVADTAGRLYTADYLGAALGALLVSTLLIPLFGVVAVCLLAAGLNLMSGAVILMTSGK